MRTNVVEIDFWGEAFDYIECFVDESVCVFVKSFFVDMSHPCRIASFDIEPIFTYHVWSWRFSSSEPVMPKQLFSFHF